MGAMTELGGTEVLLCDPAGLAITEPSDALEFVAAAYEHLAEIVVIPVERFSESFFDLRTRLAGEFIQKLVNYRIQLVVLGDISAHVEQSDALAGFVHESNRGRHVWFLQDLDRLRERLAAVARNLAP